MSRFATPSTTFFINIHSIFFKEFYSFRSQIGTLSDKSTSDSIQKAARLVSFQGHLLVRNVADFIDFCSSTESSTQSTISDVSHVKYNPMITHISWSLLSFLGTTANPPVSAPILFLHVLLHYFFAYYHA